MAASGIGGVGGDLLVGGASGARLGLAENASPGPRIQSQRAAAAVLLRRLRDARRDALAAVDRLPETCRPAAAAETLTPLDAAIARTRRLLASLDDAVGDASAPERPTFRNAA